MGNSEQEERPLSADAALAGILALMVEARERAVSGDKDVPKTEIVLAAAGLSIDEIAAATGKNRDAVRMAIKRGKAK